MCFLQCTYLQEFKGCELHSSYLNAVSWPSACTILKKNEKDFIDCMTLKDNVKELERKGVIPEVVEKAIKEGTHKDAKEILYDHLVKNGNVEALRKLCEWAIAAHGYPRMQDFGRKMMSDLL